MDCHVQTPKCVLKQFSIKEGKLKDKTFYWDLEKNFIYLSSPKSINTKKDYYSKAMEDEFSSKIESPLGKLINDINESIEKNELFYLDEGKVEVIFNYLYSLLARSPKMAEDIKNGIILRSLFSEQNIHDLSATNLFNLMQQDKLFKEYKLAFFVNYTATPLVLPTCGYYDFRTVEEEGVIHIPLTEKVCVRLFQAKHQDKYIQNGKLLLYPVSNKNVVERVNELAFETQSRYANAYLVSSSRVELERIKGKMTNEK